MIQSIGNSYCKISLSGKGMINVDCLVVSDFCNRSDVILGICSLKDYHFSLNFLLNKVSFQTISNDGIVCFQSVDILPSRKVNCNTTGFSIIKDV